MLSETWLHCNIFSSELGFINHNIFRCDRSIETSAHNRGGGVLVGVRNDVPAHTLPIHSFGVEHVFVKVNFLNTVYILCCVYFPPNSPVTSYELFTTEVENVVSHNTGCIFIICGDFNLPNITWSNDTYGVTYSASSHIRVPCVPECFSFLNFFQLNNVPNRYKTILDLVFSNKGDIVVNKADEHVVPEDHYHPTLVFESAAPVPLAGSDPSHVFFNFNKSDFIRINEFLKSFNWTDTLSPLSANDAASTLYDALHYCVLNFVPQVNYKKSKFPIWFSNQLKNTVQLKRKAHALYRSTQSPIDYTRFSNLRAQCKFLSRKCHSKYIENTESSFLKNPKAFWDFVRKTKSGNSIPATVKLGNAFSNDRASMCEMFSSHFSSVYSSTAINLDDLVENGLPHELPSTCLVSLDDVLIRLRKLRNIKSVGPDGLS
ncbi:Rna-directed dna polymerase from mobile element jockey, partial [Thalictrum thalictroides]